MRTCLRFRARTLEKVRIFWLVLPFSHSFVGLLEGLDLVIEFTKKSTMSMSSRFEQSRDQFDKMRTVLTFSLPFKGLFEA